MNSAITARSASYCVLCGTIAKSNPTAKRKFEIRLRRKCCALAVREYLRSALDVTSLLNAACHRHRFKFDENAACSPRRLEVASTICRCAMEPAGRERS
jgi:hypothetical protein